MTCYLYVGEGFTPRNLKIIRPAGEEINKVQFPYIFGGDFNNAPEKVNQVILLTKLHGPARADESQPSYELDGHASTIDFFAI